MDAVKIEISGREEASSVLLLTKEQAGRSGVAGFLGDEREVYVSSRNGMPLIYAGTGDEKSLTAESVRRAVASAADRAASMKLKSFSVQFDAQKLGEFMMAGAVAEAAFLATYSFSKYKTPKSTIERVSIRASDKCKDAVDRASIVCGNANLVKEWINDSPTLMNTAEMEKICREVCEKYGIRITVFGEKELKEAGMGMILAVGRGAASGPRMIVAEYNGNPPCSEKIALVGKGITFDSGGVNLKPTGFIETMKVDKAGALTVLAAMKAAAKLKLKVNVIGVMPFCENMIGPNSYKPSDILRSYSGKTVEITNTDAECRLILGDALAYAAKHNPKCIVDVATLTGACITALGEFTAGLFSNGQILAKRLYDSGEATGERVWQMPLYSDYGKEMEGTISDLKNAVSGPKMHGAILGAAFLQNFVAEVPWAHIDIAGTAWWEKKRYYVPQGPTGWGVRLLVDFLEKM
ncbi:MAG TPA: leucyl aminopeptidase family protein [archaeon]|nr:leucyl aminopeptidase family protein [archaeon]